MVIAVLEAVVVQRLRQNGRDLVARDVRDERAHVGADVRVGRAQVGGVKVAEGVAGSTVGVLVGAVGVEEHRPGVDGEAAGRRRPARVREHVVLARERADPGLDPEPVVTSRVGPEEELAAIEEDDLAAWIVREDVPGRVVDERGSDPAQPTANLEIVENGVDALVGEVGREGEGRRLQTI